MTQDDQMMTPTTRQSQAYTSRDRGTMKPTPAKAPNVPSLKPVRKQVIPSEPEIAAKAYEIWLAHGQESGNDQSHWFEAEQQLRNA